MRTCKEARCHGAVLAGVKCIAHASSADLVTAAEAMRNGQALDARRATVDDACLDRLWKALTVDVLTLDPAPRAPDRRGAVVKGPVCFDEAIFQDDVSFAGVAFAGPAYFDGAVFAAAADFSDAQFSDHADFDNARFMGPASFQRTVFDDHAGFEDTVFHDVAKFEGTTFRSHIDLENAAFCRALSVRGATFEFARQFGPFVVGEHLIMDNCVFAERLTVEVAAATVSARSVTFVNGVRLAVSGAEVALDNADFARASTVSRSSRVAWTSGISNREGEVDEPKLPRLVSVRGAQVGALSLSGIDLRSCRFFGAHDLHALRIEPSCLWSRTPVRRPYSVRETIAEEHSARGGAWDLPATRPAKWLQGRDGDDRLSPEQLAALYRSLRKAREDSKDQAGAGDLYYGEMEMRRHTRHRGRRGRTKNASDKTILTAYWMLSGYGLKASRACFALLCLVLASAFALREFGFTPDPPFARALLYGVESTSTVLRAPRVADYELTYMGETIQLVLRLAGPLLIGLALLAIRARVKR